MKTRKFHVLVALALLAQITIAFAQSTAFIYHGQLSHKGKPIKGEQDMRFAVFDAPTNGNQIASQSIADVPVTDGAFTVTLDFGNGIFDGSPRWLEISVQVKGGQFITLTPRQRFMPTPYAIMANSASNLLGTLPTSQLTGTISTTQLNGTIPTSQLSGPIPTSALTGDIPASQLTGTLPSALLNGTYSSPVTLDNAANSFSGNGSGLANVNAATLGGLSASNFWRLNGNGGTTSGINFLGTTDNQPLELKVNGVRAMRLEPTTNDVPNVIGGSRSNFASVGMFGVTIGGGSQNVVTNNAINAGGGVPTGITRYATISGGSSNRIEAKADYSTIAGGSGNIMKGNSAYSTISGGFNNAVRDDAVSATIGGGEGNHMGNSSWTTIGGGRYNGMTSAEAYYSTIGGGGSNFIYTGQSTIGGGMKNWIDYGFCGTIAGGAANRIGYYPLLTAGGGVIGGGQYNGVGSDWSTIGGGFGNRIGTNQPRAGVGEAWGTISGGQSNLVIGSYGTVPGGVRNVATNYSFAAGRRAQALNDGSFVWADSNDADFFSANANSFSIRSVGGARFVSAIDASGTPTAGVELPPGGGSWATLSDRNAKENLSPINPREVLERVEQMPISTWNYKSQDTSIRHIGPMAQDFAAAFQVGENDHRITTVDADGVALAAIQGLNQIVKEKDSEIQQLKQRLEKLERLMNEKSGDAK